jgi:hypothetical protein
MPELSKAAHRKYEIEEYKPDEVIADLTKDVELDKYKLPEYNKDDYDYLLQDFSKGLDKKEYESTINKEYKNSNKELESTKKKDNKDKYDVFEYTGEDALLGDYKKEKDKYELPEFTKEEDKHFNIPELITGPAKSIFLENLDIGKQKPLETKNKYSDIMKTPEKYEIPDFIKEINLGDTANDKELIQEDIDQVNKVLYNVNKEEELWDTKEKALYVTQGKSQHAKISKENEYHDILSINKPKDIQKPQISSSIRKEKVQEKQGFTKEPVSGNRDQPKQEEVPKLSLHKIDTELPISNLEELLKDPVMSIDLKKEPVETPRDDSPEYIPKMPMDLSPQNTPSDNIIGYNRPIERSQFAKKDELLAQSAYVASNPIETGKKPIELPKNKPQPKIETKPPVMNQGSVLSSKTIAAPIQKPLNPLSKVMA